MPDCGLRTSDCGRQTAAFSYQASSMRDLGPDMRLRTFVLIIFIFDKPYPDKSGTLTALNPPYNPPR
jgi:hypothetical protein